MIFQDLFDRVKDVDTKKIAVTGGEKTQIIEACKLAIDKKIAKFILVGDKDATLKSIKEVGLSENDFELIDVKEDKQKAKTVCELFRDGKTDLIMKGSISTGTLMKTALDKQYNLRGSGLLSHIATIEWKGEKLLGVTDGGITPAPTLDQKVKMTQNAITFFNKIGYEKPKVALLSAVEMPTEKIPSTTDAAIIAKIFKSNKNAYVDGPFAFDNAISEEAAKIKKIDSPVAGKADIIVAPSIEAGNMCAKGILYATGFKSGGVIIGSTAPIILLSRADDSDTKFNSILLALASL